MTMYWGESFSGPEYKVLIKFIGKSFQWLSPPLFARSSLIIVINFFPLPFPNVHFKGLYVIGNECDGCL